MIDTSLHLGDAKKSARWLHEADAAALNPDESLSESLALHYIRERRANQRRALAELLATQRK